MEESPEKEERIKGDETDYGETGQIWEDLLYPRRRSKEQEKREEAEFLNPQMSRLTSVHEYFEAEATT